MKKRVDSRIQTCMNNSMKKNERSLFIIVGDRARYEIVNFHYILAQQNLHVKPNVLWCYKKDLGFSTHQKKRMREVKNMQTKGLYDADTDDKFDLFISSNNIRYNKYSESEKVLGNTYQMLVLQDFEALTPNLLCRTIETVEGGGLIIIIIRTMTSLKQLYTITMDVHERYRTDKFQDVEPRFNERFILSLSECKNAIFMDDELNLLPISKHINQIQELPFGPTFNQKAVQELASLKKELAEKQVIGALIQKAKTLDQAKAMMIFVNTIMEKSQSTISLTAGRGRGKSATIGLSVASAVALGCNNIYVTAPSPLNVKTFFEFLMIGLEALGYNQFDKIQSTDSDYSGCLVRINISKDTRQFVQFIFPTDSEKISNSDLVVIDEAAAIPLPLVKSFLNFPLVFMSSTVTGYEGTGRSLSLKLIQEIKLAKNSLAERRSLKQVTMNDPIRYALNDPVEKWLTDLLHLDATVSVPLKQGVPDPNECSLYLVNRDVLFSFKDKTQKFLHNLMSLFVSSHYKNSPNDLQLMSDSPAHMVFVLLGPLRTNSEGKTELPDILCAIQLAVEGELQDHHINSSYETNKKPSGDLIPYNIKEQFQDPDFPKLLGGRVVRIATHQMLQRKGYGYKALEQLALFFEGKLATGSELYDYKFRSEGDLRQPLLKKVDEIKPFALDYLGTSYGLTKSLLNFWMKAGYEPLYICQVQNETTAQHSCIMIKPLHVESQDIQIHRYVEDFRRRFVQLLPFEFNKMEIALAMSVLNLSFQKKGQNAMVDKIKTAQNHKIIRQQISDLDFKRIEAYANKKAAAHLINDLLPGLCRLYFCKHIDAQLNGFEAAVLLGVGLQHKKIQNVAKEVTSRENNYYSGVNSAVMKFYKKIKPIFKESAPVIEQKFHPIVSVGNQSLALQKAGEDQTARIMKLSDQQVDKINTKTRYNYSIQGQDLSGLQIKEGQKVVTIGRTLETSRNEWVEKPKKKVKKF